MTGQTPPKPAAGEHTPLPWVASNVGVGEKNGEEIAWLWPSPEHDANISFIVTACNSHYNLIEDLQIIACPDWTWMTVEDARRHARIALIRAGAS